MARWVALTLITAAVITTAAVFFYASLDRGSTDHDVEVGPKSAASKPETPAGPPPHAVVEGGDMMYRFGIKAQHTKFTKEWVVKNKGKGELILELEPPPCACIEVKLPPEAEALKRLVIPPGGQAPVSFVWDTQKFNGRYRWPMTLLTNDVDSPKLVFIADGIIRPAVALVPESGVDMFDVYNDEESHHATITLYSPDRPDLKLIKLTTSKPDLLEVKPKPLSEGRLPVPSNQGRLSIGCHPEAGTASGSISRGGNNRDRSSSKAGGPVPGCREGSTSRSRLFPPMLRLPDISSGTGGEGTVTLLARGRKKTVFKVERKPADRRDRDRAG